ncbi:MAG: ATP-binding protein, partial [Fusobacteriales bacterium]|nr:ATP-binding protein [Fusobacteriales bacterium]
MADLNMILGDSGTGKSTSIRNLNPEETFIIQVLNKRLPFRGSKKMYTPCTKENPDGNIVYLDKFNHILKALEKIEEREEIKNLILDDI